MGCRRLVSLFSELPPVLHCDVLAPMCPRCLLFFVLLHHLAHFPLLACALAAKALSVPKLLNVGLARLPRACPGMAVGHGSLAR